MNRAARKKKAAKRREVLSLQPVPEENVGPGQYTIQRRAASLVEVILVYPNEIALSLATRDEAGTIFGRLYLVGALTNEQRIAAERLYRAVTAYRRLLHRYYGVTLTGPLDVGGNNVLSEDLSAQAEQRFARASREYNKRMDVLKACGDDVVRVVFEALENDVLIDLGLLRRGLSALSGAVPEKNLRTKAKSALQPVTVSL